MAGTYDTVRYVDKHDDPHIAHGVVNRDKEVHTFEGYREGSPWKIKAEWDPKKMEWVQVDG